MIYSSNRPGLTRMKTVGFGYEFIFVYDTEMVRSRVKQNRVPVLSVTRLSYFDRPLRTPSATLAFAYPLRKFLMKLIHNIFLEKKIHYSF